MKIDKLLRQKDTKIQRYKDRYIDEMDGLNILPRHRFN